MPTCTSLQQLLGGFLQPLKLLSPVSLLQSRGRSLALAPPHCLSSLEHFGSFAVSAIGTRRKHGSVSYQC